MSWVSKIISSNVTRLMLSLFFCLIYFTLIVHGVDKQASFIELFDKITSLVGSLAALIAAYVACIGVYTWRKQLIAANKYPSLLECRKMSVRLKNETLRMLDRAYSDGYTEDLSKDYLKDGALYNKFKTYFIEMDELFVELESNFSHSCTGDSQANLEQLLRELRLQSAVYLRLINESVPSMVSSDESESRLFEVHEHKLLRRKKRVNKLFAAIICELDLLEEKI